MIDKNEELEIMYDNLCESNDRIKIGKSIIDIHNQSSILTSVSFTNKLVFKNKRFGLKSIHTDTHGYLCIKTSNPENLSFYISKYGWIQYNDILELHRLYKDLGSLPDDTENFRLTNTGILLSEFQYYNFVDTNNIHIEDLNKDTVLIKLSIFEIYNQPRLCHKVTVTDLIKISTNSSMRPQERILSLFNLISKRGKLIYKIPYHSFKSVKNYNLVWDRLEYKDIKIIRLFSSNQRKQSPQVRERAL